MRLMPGRQIGAYRIVSLVGAGGMGEVYRARDSRLGREVALKILPEAVAADAAWLRRLRREAEALARLAHPNVMTVFEAGESDGLTFVASELLEGETLRARLLRGALPLATVYDVGRQVALGLAAAHACGLMHGDVTPGNVMLGPGGRVTLLDFGLARPIGGPSSETQPLDVAAGTSGYMAPEQIRGGEVDARSDVFALGVLLFEMHSGRRPFIGTTAADVQAAVLRDEAPPLRGAPPALRHIVARCLRKAPAERHATAGDVALLLDAARTWSHDDAAPASSSNPPGRRGQLLLMTGAAVVAAVVGWMTGTARPSSRGEAALPAAPERLTFRRGAVFDARFAPSIDGTTVVYSAAWEGGPPDIYEAGSGREGRSRQLPDALLLAASPGGDLAVAQHARAPFFGFHLGLLALVSQNGAMRTMAADVASADFPRGGVAGPAITREVSATSWVVEWPIGTPIHRSDRATTNVRVAPDGRRLAWIETVSAGTTRVMVGAPGETARVVLTQPASPGGLAWSPDGTELWYTAQRSLTLDDSEIRAVTTAGTVRPLLRQAGGLRLLDVEGDGRLLVAQSRTSIELLVQDAGGTRAVGWLGSGFLRDLSADGRVVLFTEDGPGGFDLYLRRTDGSPAIRLAEGLESNPSQLSPDATRVATTLADSILVIPVGAGSRRSIPGRLRVAAWLPDGRRLLAWDERMHGGHPVIVDVDGTDAIRPLAAMRCRQDPILSPSGHRVACRSEHGLTVHDIGGATTSIALMGDPGRMLGWSDDERRLFGFVAGRMPQHVRVIDAGSGRVTDGARIAPPDPAGVWRIQPVRITPDGRTVAYSLTRRLDEMYLYRAADTSHAR